MAESAVTRKGKIGCRSKVKTGCATCRIRKVKCDESKPFCQRCVKTGRICDGYESPFRIFTNQPINSAHSGGIKLSSGLGASWPAIAEITPQEIDLLNRYFCTKTLFDVRLGCDEEAKQVLQASLTDPHIRHAVSSLKALREDLEISGDNSLASVAQQTLNHQYGLQQYCTALGGVASKLSSSGSNGLKSALLCCQLFISIEQVRKNYAAMAQHIIRGLRIMHEHRARPTYVAAKGLVPAHHEQIPFLDVFIIKLFAAPCKFADPPTLATADGSGTKSYTCAISPQQQSIESRDLRTIAPDLRTELTRIATSTLELLGKVSQLTSLESAFQLRSEKADLLNSLDTWLKHLELVQKGIKSPGPEPISESFLCLFYLVLKVVLLSALDSSPVLHAALRTEYDRLQVVANNVGERVKTYDMCSGSNKDRSQ